MNWFDRILRLLCFYSLHWWENTNWIVVPHGHLLGEQKFLRLPVRRQCRGCKAIQRRPQEGEGWEMVLRLCDTQLMSGTDQYHSDYNDAA